jgi:amino acid adenylation domain-containing protein
VSPGTARPAAGERAGGLTATQRALLDALTRGDRDALTFPLSSAQRRLWLSHMLAPGSPAYHMPIALRLRGPLDLAALQGALDAVTKRHEALRTTFPAADGVPRQLVRATQRTVIDVRPGPAGPAALAEVAWQPFDLAAGSLLRAVLWQMTTEDHLLLLVIHHIVCDAWSEQILLRDLSACYRAAREGRVPQLAPIAVQPADFAVWEAQRIASGELDVALDRIRSRLAGRGPGLTLRRGPALVGMSGPAATLRRPLEEDLATGLREVARGGAATEFTQLLTALAGAVGHLTGGRDLVVGTPVSGRRQRDLADVAGCFVNIMPLRFRWAADAGPADLFAVVRDTLADGLADQQVPLDLVVAAVENGRRSSGSPLVDLLFSVEDQPSVTDLLDGVRAEQIPIEPVAAKAALTCVVERAAHGLVLRWEYRADAVDLADVRVLAETFPQVLRDLLAEPGLRSARAARALRAAAPPGADGQAPGGERPAGPGAHPGTGGAPQGPLEASVAQVWAEVLDLDGVRIGRDDDFFGLGGHSLLAARAAARLSTRLGVQVDLRDLLEHPTVADLAAAAGQPGRGRTEPIPRLPVSVATGPLSFPQRQVYLHSLLAPDSAAYNIPLVAVLGGQLDTLAMHAALRWVVGRHEALRTCFAMRDGETLQRVLPGPAAEPEWAERDLRGAPQRDIVTMAREDAFRPFDVGGGPLVRMSVLRSGDEEHVIALTVHHLVADGHAVRIILDELCAAYAAIASGAQPDLPPVALRYLEYAAWQRDADVGYWSAALAGAPREIDLPARPGAGMTPRGASVPVKTSAATAAAVRALAARTGCTPFMVLATAFAITLAAYSGQRDLLIGTPTANRSHPDTARLVGLLANPVVLRAELDGDPTVAQALERMRAVCVGAFARQDTPLAQVMAATGAERSHDRAPLFQVMIALNEAVGGSLGLPGLQVTPVYLDDPPAKYELLLNLRDDEEGIAGACEYAADRYEAPLVASLVRHFGRVLALLPAHLERRLSELPLLTPPEQAAVVPAASAAPARYESRVTVHHLVERAVDATPGAIAVIGAGSASLSYRKLDDAANAVAARLAGQLRPGEPVGVCAARSPELVVAEYAVLKAGGAILPLDPAWPAARLEAVLRDAGARFVLTGPTPDGPTADGSALGGAAPRGAWPDGVTELPVDVAGTAPRPPAPVRPADLATVIYTSGSTGKPKGVQVEHAALANNLLWMQQDWPLGSADRLLVKTAATFDVGVKEIFWPLIAGATLVLAPPGAERDPGALLDLLASQRITICHLVPSMLALCLETAELTGRPFGPDLRYLMCGAEELAPATRDRFAAVCRAHLLHMYGPTETTIAVTGWTCRPGDRIDGRVPLGRAMPNCRLYVLDEHLNPTPPMAWGELYVAGLPLARGYLGRYAETAAAFIPDPFADRPGSRMYRTGDVVRIRHDGLLEFRGRADGQVKIRGFRVEVGEVEAALRTHPAVRQAAVCCLTDAVLAAYVVLTRSEVTGQELRGHVRALLPDYMVPSRVVPVAELPRTDSGKVDRAALRARPLSRPADQMFREPGDDVERAVAEIWSEVLGTAPIGADDDFFSLGGQSLQAARIVNLLSERFGRDLPLRDLFTEPTVAGLARLLRAAGDAPRLAPIPRRAGRSRGAS